MRLVRCIYLIPLMHDTALINGRVFYMITIRHSDIKDYEPFAKFISILDSEAPFILYDPDERKMDNDKAKKFLTRISLENKSVAFFALNESNEIVGFVCGEVSNYNRTSHIMSINIGVLKQYHRSGAGRFLANKILEYVKLNQITRVEASIIKNNIPSLNLAKRFGFEIEGIKKNSIKIGNVYYDEYFLSKLFL